MIDKKMQLNQKMNQTLEEIAKAIFKSWFVDFDPVRAKAEGRPTGLPPEISDLFPEELVDSEVGEIPTGWEVTIVSGFGNVVCGKTPFTKDPENFGGEFPFITIPDMRGNLISLSTERSVSEKGASTLKGKMLPAGSICVSCIATPGLVSITTGDSFTNQQINSIVPFSEGDREYLLFSMMTFGDLISSAGSGGSVFANLSTGRFKELPILQANEQIRTVFSKIVRPMLRRIELSQKEITTLSQLRDTLLPKLISGELRIPHADKFLEEAGI
jgi:type I restriction enzyme S subunit